MAEPDFPLPLAGLVHTVNGLTMHRPRPGPGRCGARDGATPHLIGEVVAGTSAGFA